MYAFLIGVLLVVVGFTIMEDHTVALGFGMVIGGILGKWKD